MFLARVSTACALLLLAAQAPATDISITAKRLLDVQTGTLVADPVIVVRGERIVAVGPRESTQSRGQIIDLGDATLLPGLIDAHVHLTLAGAPDANARATLEAGFTTVQDLGALGYANIRLRDAINRGTTVGPRVVAAGPWLGVSGLTCDFQGIGVKGAAAFAERVRKDVEAGTDLIKVCASGWLPQAAKNPDAYEISDVEFKAAIEEAHKAKRRLAVHAISEHAIASAVTLGADLLVHAGFTPAASIAEMKTRGVQQLSTLWSFKQNNPPELYERLRAHLIKAVAGGLPIAFGTDAGVIPHGANANEFPELEAIGLSRAAAIRAATLDAARAVGLASELGRLESGRVADLIAVTGNPLEDLRALQKVTFVMKGGVVVRPKAP